MANKPWEKMNLSEREYRTKFSEAQRNIIESGSWGSDILTNKTDVKGQKNLSPVYWAMRSWKKGFKI